MAAAGADVTLDTNVGVVGVTEMFRALPAVVTAFRRIRRRIGEMRPDVAILIGNDVFNVLLARWLKGRGIPTLADFLRRCGCGGGLRGRLLAASTRSSRRFRKSTRCMRTPAHAPA